MIGKVMTGKSFRGCLLYCLNDKQKLANEEAKMKNRAEVLLYHKCGGRDKELIQQFNEVRRLNMKLSKPVLHITLSLAEEEKMDKEKLTQISETCAREMGFGNNQWVAVLHHDTKHPHMHIVANRIGFDGRTVSDSNSYKRIALFCRKMEVQHGLQQVLSPRVFLSEKERELPRLDKRKQKLQEDIKQCLFIAETYEQFEGLMKRKNIAIELGRGIAFIDEKKMRVKGSELGYSLSTVKRILANKQGLSVGQMHITQQVNGKEVEQGNYQNRNEAKELIKESRVNTIKALSSLLNSLTKPEDNAIEPIAKELMHKARKKKKRKLRQQ